MSEASDFAQIVEGEIKKINNYLNSFFEETDQNHPSVNRLYSSARYSLLSEGKRFRPALTLLTAKALGDTTDRALPFAAAVEFIHTYSLIHDDLPLMDNDDLRRGEPTNHKVYGEGMALLAGDGLLTESFHLLAEAYKEEPKKAIELVRVLSEASGLEGMVAGQAIDIEVLGGKNVTLDDLKEIHEKKTGALIRVAIEGAAVACDTSSEKRKLLREFGETLGVCFQLADDILDYDPKNPERSGWPALLGLEETKATLEKLTGEAQEKIKALGEKSKGLLEVTEFNFNRTK